MNLFEKVYLRDDDLCVVVEHLDHLRRSHLPEICHPVDLKRGLFRDEPCSERMHLHRPCIRINRKSLFCCRALCCFVSRLRAQRSAVRSSDISIIVQAETRTSIQPRTQVSPLLTSSRKRSPRRCWLPALSCFDQCCHLLAKFSLSTTRLR